MVWQGIFPAVTTKFTKEGKLDHAEMERCFAYQIESSVDGLVVCGSLGEGMTLEREEKLSILNIAKAIASDKPVLMTICETSTEKACRLAAESKLAGADGYMVLHAPPYISDRRETIDNYKAIAMAGDRPVMIYNNPPAYGVDVDLKAMEILAEDSAFVAVKESTDNVRRVTELINRFGDRFDIFTGIDNLGLESLMMGAVGWVAGLVVAFPKETVAIYQLARKGRYQEALEIYRWFRPLLDLDVSTKLVQNIKLAEKIELQSTEYCRRPRQPLSGKERDQAEKIIHTALKNRPDLSQYI